MDDFKLAGKKQNLDSMWKVLNKEVDLGEPTSFLDHVYLGCTQRKCEISKDIVDNYRTMFESRISAGGVEKLPFPQHIRISSWSYDMAAAVDKEWEKLEKISAWNLTKVKSKKQVIDEARTSGATVHFASLMDICHLKNAEMEAKHQKYKGRVVLRGDIVKDNSGAYAVFTEQGSSASQMTAAKIMDIISRLDAQDRQLTQYLLKPS